MAGCSRGLRKGPERMCTSWAWLQVSPATRAFWLGVGAGAWGLGRNPQPEVLFPLAPRLCARDGVAP